MKKSAKSGFYPILINLNRFDCIVVGGGKVAYRKVLSLLNFNTRITVLSSKICKPLIELSEQKRISVIKKNYSKEFIKDFKIVFCATDNPEVNKEVRRDCTKEGILLNVADVPGLCDFILPANVNRGDLTISISSQGKAPFYTKEMKRKIEEIFSQVYSQIIELAGEFRKQVLKNPEAADNRIKSKMFKVFTSKNWEQILTENGKKSSKHYVQKILREFNISKNYSGK